MRFGRRRARRASGRFCFYYKTKASICLTRNSIQLLSPTMLAMPQVLPRTHPNGCFDWAGIAELLDYNHREENQNDIGSKRLTHACAGTLQTLERVMLWNWCSKKDCLLNRREPDTPLPALSKEEKKRNRPSFFSLPDLLKECLTLNLRLTYANPTILQVLRKSR